MNSGAPTELLYNGAVVLSGTEPSVRAAPVLLSVPCAMALSVRSAAKLARLASVSEPLVAAAASDPRSCSAESEREPTTVTSEVRPAEASREAATRGEDEEQEVEER